MKNIKTGTYDKNTRLVYGNGRVRIKRIEKKCPCCGK